MPLFPVVHILGLLHGRRRREKNLAVLDTRARRVVGALHRERAPRARFIPLPCRARARARTLLLDDRIPRRSLLMGPVGAPEIPTRTGHNARLKVGFTTDRQDPDGWNHVQQGRIVTSPGPPPPPPPPASPRALTPSSRPSIFCPYHTAPRAFLPLLVSFAPSSSLHSSSSSTPVPPVPRSWPFSFSLPPLFSHALLARARARAPHQWQDRGARPETPCISPDRARMPRHSVA